MSVVRAIDGRWDVRRYAEVDSTNRVVADLARQGAADGVVVVADHQTAGRGRHGRRWEAPPGSSLLVSVLVRPAAGQADGPQLMTVAAGVAAAEACLEASSVDPRLKWPNDLVVGDLKLAGLLTELVAPDAVVIGLGLNVNWHEPLPDGATALNHLTGEPADREALLRAFLTRLPAHTDALGTPATRDQLLTHYRQLCVTLGRRVAFQLVGEDVSGQAVGIDAGGHLVVEGDGDSYTVSAGTVTHLAEGST